MLYGLRFVLPFPSAYLLELFLNLKNVQRTVFRTFLSPFLVVPFILQVVWVGDSVGDSDVVGNSEVAEMSPPQVVTTCTGVTPN